MDGGGMIKGHQGMTLKLKTCNIFLYSSPTNIISVNYTYILLQR